MCGIAGFFMLRGVLEDPLTVLHKMGESLAHRGPDDKGTWQDRGYIGFAHRRLAIQDLSPSGHQPMVSHNGRYVIVFNGEIYNHRELRAQLDKLPNAPVWKGHSDTESLLEGFSRWGVEATLLRCTGMFAFALWDKTEKVLALARDRLGEKPLYYGNQGTGKNECFIFSSELSAFKYVPGFSGEISRLALRLLMRHSYIPSPYSIFQGVKKLMPGNVLRISAGRSAPEMQPYWSFATAVADGVASQTRSDTEEVIVELESLLRSSVQCQLISDVPVGAFLSGGIDSSLVVALMQSLSAKPIETFSIGFEDKRYDESQYASAVATHLGTRHSELIVTAKDALDVIPKLPEIYSEPFADSSQIPTFLVSKLARQSVTVALSGDGGDELFGGYSRYTRTNRYWKLISKLPLPLRTALQRSVRALPEEKWNAVLSPLTVISSGFAGSGSVGRLIYRGSDVIFSSNLTELYSQIVCHWTNDDLILDDRQSYGEDNNIFSAFANLDGVRRMMAIDTISSLPDDMLTKVDRASMAVSLESRVPFLDQRIVEFAWRLPDNMKFRGGSGKFILRRLLSRYVPAELIDRPKQGFELPLREWLRGPLREWAESLLEERRLREEGFFNPAPIRAKWGEHLSGRGNWEHHLWDVLMFQSWLERTRSS